MSDDEYKETFIYRHKDFVKFLKKNGYNEGNNICDFWFVNKSALLPKLSKKFLNYGCNTVYLEEIETQIRWESDIGKIFVLKIREYINEEQENLRKSPIDVYTKNLFTEIDLASVSVIYEGKEVSIKQFAEMFDTSSKIEGVLDLRGITLNGIHIDNFTLTNLCFSYSNFLNSHIQQCVLNNIMCANCNFTGSHISGIRIDKSTHFSGSNFKNCYVCIFSKSEVKEPNDIGEIQFNRMTYFQLLKLTFNKKPKKRKYTVFSIDKVEFYSKDKDVQNYLSWYDAVTKRILNMDKANIFQNINLVMQIIITKYWMSYISLILFSIIIISAFANIYFYIPGMFNKTLTTFFEAFYYSIICFTRLGSTNIIPITDFAQVVAMSENIFGYIFLVMFVYLLSQKLRNKY